MAVDSRDALLVTNIKQVVEAVMVSHLAEFRATIKQEAAVGSQVGLMHTTHVTELKDFFKQELETELPKMLEQKRKELRDAAMQEANTEPEWMSRHFRAYSATVAKKREEQEMVDSGQAPSMRPKIKRINTASSAGSDLPAPYSPKRSATADCGTPIGAATIPGLVDSAAGDGDGRQDPDSPKTVGTGGTGAGSEQPPSMEATISQPQTNYVHGYTGPEFAMIRKSSVSASHFLNDSAMRHVLRKVVMNPKFESGVCLLIFLNAIVLGVQTDLLADMPNQVTPVGLVTLESIVCVLFVVELVLRLYINRLAFFYMIGWQWNIFDFFIVFVQVVEQLLTFAVAGDESMPNFSAARVVRSMKLFRLLRIARVMNFFKELRILVISIFNSVRSLVWVVVLMIAIIYIFSIYLTQIVTEHKYQVDTEWKERDSLNRHFGSLGTTMLSMFMAITGGLDWEELWLPLNSISPMVSVLLCVFIAFGLLAMLNVVTGIFVESVLKSQATDRDLFMVSNVRELFQSLEGGLVGTLSWPVFEQKLYAPQMQAFLKAIDVDPSEAKHLFRLLDLDCSGEISADEFLNGALRLRGAAKALDVALLIQEVRKVDRNVRVGPR